MDERQKELVRASFARIWPIAETVAELFYARLFELDPRLRRLFDGDLAAQGRALMGMLRVAVNGLDQVDELVPALQDLGRRHARYGVREPDYATVGRALLDTLERGLGPAFTAEMRDASFAAYALLADVMQAAARAPRATGGGLLGGSRT